MIFQNLMGPRKSRCDICNGTTQGCFHPNHFDFAHTSCIRVFVMPIATFEKTHVQLKSTV
jgi:hypothetical protein